MYIVERHFYLESLSCNGNLTLLSFCEVLAVHVLRLVGLKIMNERFSFMLLSHMWQTRASNIQIQFLDKAMAALTVYRTVLLHIQSIGKGPLYDWCRIGIGTGKG